MRRYEQIYILRPSLSEEEISRVVDNTNQLILDDSGAVIFLSRWGMKKLAYPIKKETQGYYVFCDFAATSDVVSEIERKFRIDDAVLKYLTVKISDAITTEEISEATSEAQAMAAADEVAEETTEDKQQDKAPEIEENDTTEDQEDDSTDEPEDKNADQ